MVPLGAISSNTWVKHLQALRLRVAAVSWPAASQPALDDDTAKPRPKPRFQAIDGDTVKFSAQRVRMFGIDAPEKGPICDEGQWRPGLLAKKALKNFIAGRPVMCRQVDYDQRNNRPVAQCFAVDDDLQAMMVLAGWAWAVQRSLRAGGVRCQGGEVGGSTDTIACRLRNGAR